jgi:hypothetical protein
VSRHAFQGGLGHGLVTVKRTALFKVDVLAPHGILATGPDVAEEVVVDSPDAVVVVTPIIQQAAADGSALRPGQQGFYLLKSLQASVTRDIPSERISAESFPLFHAPAVGALYPLLRALRIGLDRPYVDVKMSSLVWLAELDENGQHLLGSSFFVERMVDGVLRGMHGEVLSKETWSAVVKLSRADRRSIGLAIDWLQDARQFLGESDHTMALLAAVVACEVALNLLTTQTLLRNPSLARSLVDQFTSDVSHRQTPTFLAFAGVIPVDQITPLRTTFNTRNEVVHGKRARPVSKQEAEAAIDMATKLVGAASEVSPARRKLPS